MTLEAAASPVNADGHDDQRPGPLTGLTVVDFTELLPGPFMTQGLVDLGATVIKVERPGGDNARHLSPLLFSAINRGKQLESADLKNPHDQHRVHAILEQADVLVEGFRPGVMGRLGLGPDAVLERHPGIVYVSMSGFGQTGPWANEPGHDLTYIARAGLLSLSGEVDGEPKWTAGVPVADLATAGYAMSSLLAALYARERTGRGAHVDVSITDCLTHWLTPRLAAFRAADAESLSEQRRASLTRPAYGIFLSQDRMPIAIAAIEDHFWRSLTDVLGLQEKAPRQWGRYADRSASVAAVNHAIGTAISDRSGSELLTELRAAGVPAAELLSPEEALAATDRRGAAGVVVDRQAGALPRYPVVFTQA